MTKKHGIQFVGHGFVELDRSERKDFDRLLLRKIPHNDSLTVDGVRGIFHQVPSPSKQFSANNFDEAEYAQVTMKLLKRLRVAAPKVVIAQTFSNAFRLDLVAWDRTWPPEVHALGFGMDSLYIVAEDFSFGIVSEPFNRRFYYFGKPLLKILEDVRELRPRFYT